MSILTRLVLPLATVLSLTACEPSPPTGSAGENRGVLNVGLLPDEDPLQQRQRYAPLIEAIRGKTGLDVQLVLSADYDELVRQFAEGAVDLAYFGGYTFVVANKRHGAVPLVMRDIDARFVSQVVVHRNNTAVRQLSDLRGARFSFGSRRSTSGHIMPRHFFSGAGIVPEKFFSQVVFSGAHDRTVMLVVDGSVDAGVANGQILRSMLESGSAPPVRIIWQSRPYVDYVWAAQPSMSAKTRSAIK